MPSTIPTTVLSGVPTWNTSFSGWVPFQNRTSLRHPAGQRTLAYPGVYLMAHFPHGAPAGAADFLADEIVYVGKSNHMRGRTYDFGRAAQGKGGHSGGNSYYAQFQGLRPDLHVAALPIWFGNTNVSETPLTSFFVDWAEAHVVCSLAVQRRGLPHLVLLNQP